MKTMVIFNGKRMNFYEFFEVAENGTDEELKSAYRKMCLKFHPDKHQGSKLYEDNFKLIQAIWEIIGDKFNRSRYDNALAIERGEIRQQPHIRVNVVYEWSPNSSTTTQAESMANAFASFQAQQANRKQWADLGGTRP